MMKLRDRYSTLATFAGTALLYGVTATAQMQSAPSPTPQTMPNGSQQTEPGMSPVNPNSNASLDPNSQTSAIDKVFVEEALKGGMAEVQLGQLALQKSSNDDVKKFAQRMITDHTKMGNAMKPVAEQIGVKMPDGPSKKDKATIAKLEGLSGDAFDQAYTKDMIKDHKADLNDFNAEAENGTNPVIKNAALQGSQMISQHLQMIEQIAQKDGVMASTGDMK